jgi:hypothetical protein
MEKCKNNIIQDKPDKSGNNMLNNLFVSTNNFLTKSSL